MKTAQLRQQTESQTKKRDLWAKIKYANLCIIGIPEGDEREKEVENEFEEIMTETFPHLKNRTHIQVQEASRVPEAYSKTRYTQQKLKGKTLKEVRQKVSYSDSPIRLSPVSTTEMLQARWKWQDIFKVLKEKDLQPRILYAAR